MISIAIGDGATAYQSPYQALSLHSGANGDTNQGDPSPGVYPSQLKGYAEFGITEILHANACPGGYTQAVSLGSANGDLNQGNSGNFNTLCYTLQSSIADPYVVDFAVKLGASGTTSGCEAGYEGVPISGTNGDANEGNAGSVVGFCMLRAYGARR